jgi:hypothetical protein
LRRLDAGGVRIAHDHDRRAIGTDPQARALEAHGFEAILP